MLKCGSYQIILDVWFVLVFAVKRRLGRLVLAVHSHTPQSTRNLDCERVGL